MNAQCLGPRLLRMLLLVLPLTAHAATPNADECVPSCRSGYVCRHGECISRCNPVCGASERCLPNGECEPLSSVQSPAPSAASGPGSGVSDTAGPVTSEPPDVFTPITTPSGNTTLPKPASAALAEPGRFVLGAHLGVELIGGGTQQIDCERLDGSSCLNFAGDYDDKSYVELGVEGMFHATRGFRLGLGYWIVPRAAFSPSGGSTLSLGSEHGLVALIEGIVPLGPKLALALRSQAGPRLLVFSADLADRKKAVLQSCTAAGDLCSVESGSFLGATVGTMAGLIFGSRPRWRVDLALERLILPIGNDRFTSDGFTLTTTLYGTRFWLVAGAEL